MSAQRQRSRSPRRCNCIASHSEVESPGLRCSRNHVLCSECCPHFIAPCLGNGPSKSIRGRMLLINRILLQSIRGRQAFSLDQVREVVRTFSIKYEPQGWRNRNHRASKCPNLPCGLPLCAPPSADRSHRPAAKCKDWGSTFTEPLMHWRCSQTDAMLLRVRGVYGARQHSKLQTQCKWTHHLFSTKAGAR